MSYFEEQVNSHLNWVGQQLERMAAAQERIAAADERRNELLEADQVRRDKAWADDLELRKALQLGLLEQVADQMEQPT